jgi:Leucine-rich repeat (LRR) protein
LDLKPLTHLKKLNCSWNRLHTLTELSDTITDLIVDNNNIDEIDLSELINLEKVDCVNNVGIILKNVPVGVMVNGEASKVSSIEQVFSVLKIGGSKTKDNDGNNDGYEDVLNKYFKLKHDYKIIFDATKRKHNEKIKKSKKDKSMPTPVCVRCKRKGDNL